VSLSFLRPLAVASAVIVLMAGCAPGPEGGDKLDPAKSPLAEYYSTMYGGGDEEDFAKQQQKVEELVAVCMADEGFEYIPVDQSQYMSTSDVAEYDPQSKKWVAENGYGITTQNGMAPEVDPEEEQFVDPNQSYVEALSATEQTAYYETLYGVSPTEEEMNNEEYEYSWEKAGCQGAAQHEVRPQAYDDEKYQPLLEKMNTIYETVQRDPKVAELDSSWSSCMADAGFTSYAKKQDAMDAVIEKSNALYEDGSAEGPSDEMLKEVQEFEIETAMADLECATSIDYQDTVLGVQFELEKQFIADNKSELDAMVAEYEQAG
jgi:hypothetical protein